MSSRVARLSEIRSHDFGRASFLISPARPTRRSATGKRSTCEIPDAPVMSDDQKASTSWPIGVTTPAAAITMRGVVRALVPLMLGNSEGGFAPLPKPPPRRLHRQSRRSNVEHSHLGANNARLGRRNHAAAQRQMFHSERGLCPRNRFLGEVSEGAVEAPSDY